MEAREMADNPKGQLDKFKQAAREQLGCDDDPKQFKDTVRKVAKAPPAPRGSKAKAKAKA
jgi:hypothetical protein